MNFLIRKAEAGDAEMACAVLRWSITELCQADHHNNVETLKSWLANKTPDNVREWITAPDSHVYVAYIDDEVVGVGAVTDTGLVTLNYVLPQLRFQGVSKALIARLEACARDLGVRRCTLETTETARRFYRTVGYADEHDPPSKRMSKLI
jgi:GNAT superfamily N-acetyltransferase